MAIAIGAGSCICAVFLLARARENRASGQWFWFSLATLIFGTGVWTTHFVAMIAEEPAMNMGYAILPTALSAAIAILGAVPAFTLMLESNPAIFQRISSALILGGSVAAMHFTGMAAMRFDGSLDYRPGYVIVAITLGIILNALAWRRVDRLPHAKAAVETGTFLVLGIAAIHFISMAGTRFVPGPAMVVSGILIGRNVTLTSAAACAIVAGLALAIGIFDQRWRWMQHEAARLRELADCTIEGLLIHKNGEILWANSMICQMLKSNLMELAGRNVIDLVTSDWGDTVRRHLLAGVHSIDKIEISDANGKLLSAEIASRLIRYGNRPAGVIALRDITERCRAEAQIEHLAFYDTLTGLANRRKFDRILTETVESATTEHPVSLLMVDLDRFKAVNDLHGHPIGDLLLQHVASRLQRLVRHDDLVARLGGDEFSIVVPNASTRTITVLAEGIIKSLSLPFEVDGLVVMIGASVGIAMAPNDASCTTSLMQASDFALVRAKREGRNRCCFFEVGMDVRLRERRAIEQDLRRAIEARTLEVHYQPLVNVVTAQIVGYEALVRWCHIERGWIAPSEFIPIAEESGLIVLLGQFILERAVQAACEWPNDIILAVNLSPIQFNNPSLPEDIIETISRLGLPAERLELEITENVLIDDSSRALRMLKRLKDYGIRIALDDFGTGYSSLGTLRQFPFDKLKIDRSFVQNLGIDADATSMVHTILAMGKNLRLAVTAEGVETQVQLDALCAAGCDFVQGYLIGRPSSSPLGCISTSETAV